MKDFEEFKQDCYNKDSQISLQTIELLYILYINQIADTKNPNLDEKATTKKTRKKNETNS